MLNPPQLRALENIREHVLLRRGMSARTERDRAEVVKRLLAEKPCSKKKQSNGVDVEKRTLVYRDTDSTATPPLSHHNSPRLPLTFCTFSLGNLLSHH